MSELVNSPSVGSAEIVDDAIVNADVNASAAIDYSKLAALASANILVGSAANVATVTAVTGDVTINNTGVTAIGAAKVTEAMQAASSGTGLGVLRTARAKYSFAVDGGAVGAITPASTALIPDNAIIVAATVNSTTAVVGTTSTLAVGTTAGSSATSILAATAEATLSIDAVLNGVPVFATPVKMTAAGSINVTVGTNDLTAGIVEVTCLYFVAAA